MRKNTVRIGIAGPFDLQPLWKYIDPKFRNIPKGVGGTGLPQLVAELLKRGQRTTIFTFDQKITETIIVNGPLLRIYICPIRKNKKARDFYAIERKFLVNSIHNEKIDFIHAHWTYEYALAGLDSGVPTLVTARDAPLTILQYNFSPYQIARTIMATKVIMNTKNMTAVSPYISQHLKKYFHYYNKISVIPNGFSNEVFSFYKKRAPATNKKIIFAAAISWWGKIKNTGVLLEAFSLARSKLEQTELWLFGHEHGPNESAEQLANKKGYSNNVRFIGHTDYQNLLNQLSTKVDILVHPSLSESFSNIVVEGLAVGLPVIAGNNGGAVPSTLGYGKAGRLVDMHSPRELADVMIELASDKKKRQEWGVAGRTFALEHYRIEQVCDKYQELYEEFE